MVIFSSVCFLKRLWTKCLLFQRCLEKSKIWTKTVIDELNCLQWYMHLTRKNLFSATNNLFWFCNYKLEWYMHLTRKIYFFLLQTLYKQFIYFITHLAIALHWTQYWKTLILLLILKLFPRSLIAKSELLNDTFEFDWTLACWIWYTYDKSQSCRKISKELGFVIVDSVYNTLIHKGFTEIQKLFVLPLYLVVGLLLRLNLIGAH